MAEPYIVFRRFKGQGINGPVNLRYGELVERKRVRTCENPRAGMIFLPSGNG